MLDELILTKTPLMNAITNHDCRRWTGAVRIGYRRASAKKYGSSSWRAQFLASLPGSWPIAVVVNNVKVEMER